MLAEYDFSGGVRGKYAARFAAGTNVVVLAPDVAEAFPDSAAAVNEALRALIKIARISNAESNGVMSATRATGGSWSWNCDGRGEPRKTRKARKKADQLN